MENLQTALKQVREQVLAGVAFDEAVADAAEEFALNPKLIERKFGEQYGSVDALLALSGKQAELAVKTAASQEQAALAAAITWSTEFRLSDLGRQLVGKIFDFKGAKYVFVTINRNEPKWGLKAVRLSDCGRRKFPYQAWNAILDQVIEKKND